MRIAISCAVPYIVVCFIAVGYVVVKERSVRPLVVVGNAMVNLLSKGQG